MGICHWDRGLITAPETPEKNPCIYKRNESKTIGDPIIIYKINCIFNYGNIDGILSYQKNNLFNSVKVCFFKYGSGVHERSCVNIIKCNLVYHQCHH